MLSVLSTPSALAARFALAGNQANLSQPLTRLSTGRKINAGKDDPAGLISSEQLAAAIAALEAEARSLQRADSNASITDGHLAQLSSMLTDLNGLAVASANTAGLSEGELEAYQLQADSLIASLQRSLGDTLISLGGFSLPSGNDSIRAALAEAGATLSTLMSGGSNGLTGGNLEGAQAAIAAALSAVTTARGTVGAYQRNTVGAIINSNRVSVETLSRARSAILDTDFAVESSNLTKYQILNEANTELLKIAEQQAESVLALLS